MSKKRKLEKLTWIDEVTIIKNLWLQETGYIPAEVFAHIGKCLDHTCYRKDYKMTSLCIRDELDEF